MTAYDAFAAIYDRWSAGMTDDVAFYVEVARESAGPVVELAVGTAWNAFAFDHAIAARLDGRHLEEPVPHTLRYSVGENRIDITLDSRAAVALWWATKNEWLGLMDVAGLEVEALYGGFDRRPFDDEAREYVWIARKP